MKQANESGLIKVTLKYDDGEIRSLSGNTANEWEKNIDGAISIARSHGHTLSSFDWNIERKAGIRK